MHRAGKRCYRDRSGFDVTNDPANTPAVSRFYDGFRGGVNNNIVNGKGKLWQTETAGAGGNRTEEYGK